MNARIVLFVSIALLVGVGGGYGLGQALATVGQTARTPLPDNADAGPDEPEPARPAPPPREDPTPVKPDTPQPHSSGGGESTEPAATSAVTRIPVPLGAGVVTGSFTDDTGAPVAGITAQLQLDTAALRPKTPRLEDFGDDTEAYFRAMMAFHEQATRLQLDATLRATSDAQGKFRFEQVPDGNSRLYVRPVTYLVDPGQPSFNKAAKPGDNIDIKLIRALPVRVRVEPPAGDAPKSTWLRWTARGEKGVSGGQSVEPGKEVTVHLVRGSYTFRANFESAPGGSADLDLGETPPSEVIVVGNKPTRGVVGVVRFSGARPFYYAVQVAQVVPGLTDQELFSGRQGIHTANTELDAKTGKFQWEQPLDGEYAFALRVNNRVLDVQKSWLGGTVREMEFVLAQPDAPRLKVTVQAPASEQQRTPNIGVMELPNNRGIGHEVWVVSDTEYFVFFTGHGNSRPLPQKARLNVSMQGLGTIGREFVPGSETDITVTFAEPAEVSISVEGAPLGLRQVQVSLTDTVEGRSARNFTLHRNHDGSWRREVSTLQPGTYKATATGEWGSGPVLDTQEITLVSGGGNSMRIKVPDLHTVKLDGSGFKLRGGAQVEQKSTGQRWDVNFDNTHMALMTLLPTGQYRLHFRDPQAPREMAGFDFTAPSSGSVTVTK